jgi:hypothetical protein
MAYTQSNCLTFSSGISSGTGRETPPNAPAKSD